ncbi:MAG TPA: tetratricopeptide repeat protein [Chloroflexota bacterium]
MAPPPATTDALEQARVLAAQGDVAQARELLEASTEHADVRLALAAIQLQSGEYAEGLATLDTLVQLGVFLPVVEAYRGGALLGLGHVSDAKDVLDAAYTVAPDDFYVALKRGELYCRLGIYPTALEALEHAVLAKDADSLGREAARRLLRFARTKAHDGFVRRIAARTSGLRWPLRGAARTRSEPALEGVG